MTKKELLGARETSTKLLKALGMADEDIKKVLAEVEEEMGIEEEVKRTLSEGEEKKEIVIGDPITVTITNVSSMVSMIIDIKDVDGVTFDLNVKGNGKLQEETEPTVSDRIIALLSDTIYATLGNFENED